eukprot:maker-scaffold_14-snap-gene-4.54-mRNA-1 protein AED:0.03 eAED:0.03 QI:100/1/1/1/1/1/4/138/228
MAKQQIYVSYFMPVLNETGDNPNLFILDLPEDIPFTLGFLKAMFPLDGAFHFRYKDEDRTWVDCLKDSEILPCSYLDTEKLFIEIKVTICRPKVKKQVAGNYAKNSQLKKYIPEPCLISEEENSPFLFEMEKPNLPLSTRVKPQRNRLKKQTSTNLLDFVSNDKVEVNTPTHNQKTFDDLFSPMESVKTPIDRIEKKPDAVKKIGENSRKKDDFSFLDDEMLSFTNNL